METKDLRKRELWAGEHNGVQFEIVKWTTRLNDTPHLNYYLWLTPDNTSPEQWGEIMRQGKGRFDYDATWVSELAWHGGCTLAEYVYDDGDITALKAGCDYLHAFDRNMTYALEGVLADCINTIDGITERIIKGSK